MIFPHFWDDSFYLDANLDVRDAVESGGLDNGWAHFRRWGSREGRLTPKGVRKSRLDGYKLTREDYENLNGFRLRFEKSTPSINYVIASWSGPRRGGYTNYDKNYTYFLDLHLKSLNKLDHSLSQITIVLPKNIGEPKYFSDYIDSLPKKIKNTPIMVVRRENNSGQSYGSYSDVYEIFRDSFEYYILIEDDYGFIQNNFDIEMISNLCIRNNCGFLCSLILEELDTKDVHAAISNGVTSSEVLEKIWNVHKKIPHTSWDDNSQQKGDYYNTGPQIHFSNSFVNAGYSVSDLTPLYRSPFNSSSGELEVFAPYRDSSLIVPLQHLF